MRPVPLTAALSLVAGLLAAAGPVAAVVEVEEPVRLSGAGAVPGTAGISHHRVGTALDGYAVAAWLEAVVGSGDQLMARTREPGGEWSPAVQVSDSTNEFGVSSALTVSLAVNADGDAALAWRQFDSFGGDAEHMVFAATLDRGAATWSSARVGGQEHGVSQSTPSVVVMPDGVAVVGWLGYVDEEHQKLQVYANEGDEGGWGMPVQISDTGGPPINCLAGEDGCEHGDTIDLALAADGAGAVRALMRSEARVSDGAGGTTQRIWILQNSRDPGGGWAAATPITSVADPYVQPAARVLVGDATSAGFATAWSVPATDSQPAGIRLEHEGVFRVYRHATFEYGLSGLSLAGGHAVGLLSYVEDSASHFGVVALDPGDENWSEPSDPAEGENLSNGPTPSLRVDSQGGVTVLWALGSPRRVRITQRAAGSGAWDFPQTVYSTSVSQALPGLGIDQDGGGTVIWRSTVDGVAAVFATAFAPEQVDPVPPSLTMTAPTKLLTRAPSWTVGWESTDEGGGVGGTDVAASDTAWDEVAATTYSLEFEDTSETSYAVVANPATLSGHTFCYAARGRADGQVEVGAWSAPLCTVTPVDDRSLTRVGSTWSARTGSGRWDETYVQSKRKGAALRLEGVHASNLGLLVEKGKGFGTVKVVFDGDLLGKVALDGKARKRVVVPLGSWPDARSGTLVVKVISKDGRLVRIDGVYAGQPSDAAFTG